MFKDRLKGATLYILSILPVIVIGFAVYVRLAPLPEGRFVAMPGPNGFGIHEMPGGVKSVIPLSDLPQGAEAALQKIVLATPRTVAVSEPGAMPLAYVTRSAVFGFPDIALIWTEGGALHVHSHLVYGLSDIGVNSARVASWRKALGQRAPG